jgi:hypothetical protein
MPRKPKPPQDDPAQSTRFIEMAREIGVDESEGAFERAFKKVVSSKSNATAKTPPPRDKKS